MAAKINHKLLSIVDIKVPDVNQKVEDVFNEGWIANGGQETQAELLLIARTHFGLGDSSTDTTAVKLIFRRLVEQIRRGTQTLGTRKVVTLVTGNEESFEATSKLCALAYLLAESQI